MSVNLLEPVGNIVKCLLFSAVVDENDTHSTLVICLGNRAETLLAGSIPHLELDALILDVDGLDLEVDT